jgi:RHS repeat-associated protein
VQEGAALPAVTHRYDANGNMVEETASRRFAWDRADRLVAFREVAGAGPPSLEAFYLYDASGTRTKKLVRKQDGSVGVTVYVDGIFEHHLSVAPGGARAENNTVHVMDAAARVAMLRAGPAFAGDAAPTQTWQVADHLGSATLAVDATGGWVNREEYTPYGETSFGGYARKRYRFSGKEQDEESGLMYFGHRHYAPWQNRWTSCDPAGAVDGPNMFAYVGGNPVALKDMIGLSATKAVATDPKSFPARAAASQEKLHNVESSLERHIKDYQDAIVRSRGPQTNEEQYKAVGKALACISHRVMAQSDRRLADGDGARAEVVRWSGQVCRGRARPSPPAGPRCGG